MGVIKSLYVLLKKKTNYMFNVGIIGYGKMGKIRAEAIEQCGGIVKYIYDINITGNEKYKNKPVDEIIKDKDVDIIFVCVPNYLNKQLTIDGMKNGKHVFCEKPPTLTVCELKEVIEVEKKTKKKLMYGFNHRHHDSVKYIKKLIDRKLLGDVIWLRGRYGKNVDQNYFNGWRSKKEYSGGGILIDQGIHMLDLFLCLTGSFDQIYSFLSYEYWNIKGIEDNAFVILKNNKTGITASLHSTMSHWRHLFSLEIFLTNGYLTLNGLKTPSGLYGNEVLTISNKNKVIKETEISKDIMYKIDNSWISEVGCFFDSIKNNTNIKIGSSKDALNLMNIIDNIYSNNKD